METDKEAMQRAWRDARNSWEYIEEFADWLRVHLDGKSAEYRARVISRLTT